MFFNISEPFTRDIITINASPKLASQAPSERRTTLRYKAFAERAAIAVGIRITKANIKLSRNSNDIKRWP